jgi:hypothetical protein
MKNIKYGFNNWESYRKIAETLDCGANVMLLLTDKRNIQYLRCYNDIEDFYDNVNSMTFFEDHIKITLIEKDIFMLLYRDDIIDMLKYIKCYIHVTGGGIV